MQEPNFTRRQPLLITLPERQPLPINLSVERPVSFDKPAPPIFVQRYGKGQGVDSTMRWVDIGSPHLAQIEQAITKLNGLSGVLVELPRRSTAIGNVEEYQHIRFGSTSPGDLFRGFIMIEPENLLEAIQRLNYLGKLRIADGESLYYKWTQPEVKNGTSPRVKALSGRQLQALYRANPMNALIQLFASDQAQIELIFDQLIKKAQWEDIEKAKRVLCAGVNITKPQKGKMRYNQASQDFYTLEI